jgi:hypothetical protein
MYLSTFNAGTMSCPTPAGCGLYYKPMTIVNDDSRVINKLEASLIDDTGVIIYNRHMFIVQATDLATNIGLCCKFLSVPNGLAYHLKLHYAKKLAAFGGKLW